jgi:hypothetical protein
VIRFPKNSYQQEVATEACGIGNRPFLVMFDFEFYDEHGSSVAELPTCNFNNQNASHPDKPEYLRIWARED